MWQHASLVRDAGGLQTLAATLETLSEETRALRAPRAGEAARILDLLAGLDCARIIVAAAAFREESRGAHWRSDFPETSDAWFGSTLVRWPAGETSPTLEFRSKLISPLPSTEGAGVAHARP